MYSVIINWKADWEIPPGGDTDRLSVIPDPQRAASFKQFLDAGLVSNSAGPNCYIRTVDGTVEFCNATWQTLEAAQEWANLTKDLAIVSRVRVLDEAGNTLVSYPE